VIDRDIRAYMARDWEAARAAKDAYWAERIALLGPEEGFRIAEELRQQALRQSPGWPTEAERREDLLAHERLAERMQRAGFVRRG
jgi:hypothetical protein